MIKRRFYAECNKYGLNLSHDSVGWRLFAFDRREHRDKFVDHMNEVSDRPVAQAISTKTPEWRMWRINQLNATDFDRWFIPYGSSPHMYEFTGTPNY